MAICQALYQGIEAADWSEMHEQLEEVSKCIGVKKARQRVASLGKLACTVGAGRGTQLLLRKTVEDSTAGLGQTLRTGRLMVGGLSFRGVPGMCMFETPRPMQA